MSSGKKFSECVYCIHYKSPHAGLLCSACEKEKPFAGPSQFKTLQNLSTKEEYEALRNCLRKYYNKPILKEEKLVEILSSLGHVNALSAKELREAMDKEEK